MLAIVIDYLLHHRWNISLQNTNVSSAVYLHTATSKECMIQGSSQNNAGLLVSKIYAESLTVV